MSLPHIPTELCSQTGTASMFESVRFLKWWHFSWVSLPTMTGLYYRLTDPNDETEDRNIWWDQEQFDPPTLKVWAWGRTACQQPFRGQTCPSAPRTQTDSNNGLIEKWLSRNLGGMWRIWRSDDEAVVVQRMRDWETGPDCSVKCCSLSSRLWMFQQASSACSPVWLSQYQQPHVLYQCLSSLSLNADHKSCCLPTFRE